MQKSYYANGQQIVLTADPGQVAVRFREPAPMSMRATVAESLSLGPFGNRQELPGEKYTILSVDAPPSASALSAVSRAGDARREVARVAPVFRVGPNHVVATDRVIVAFDAAAEAPRSRLLAKGLEILEEGGGRFVVRLADYEDPFEVTEELRTERGVRFAEPDFVIVGRNEARGGDPATAVLAGPAPEAQYALRVTRAREAQQLQPGRPEIRIAILDEGVDPRHPDLKPALHAEFDAIDGDTYQEPLPGDSHGTACAGLAVGVPNTAQGVRGVATGCGLVAVRIAQSDVLGRWVTSPSVITKGLDWAARHADVLSNSWYTLPSTDVTEAIQRARTTGRGGRGCVVVASAGNHSGEVLFPASLAEVLTVAASNHDDQPKDFDSSDGEDWWGSCFGPEVQIAAPGVRNYTTDNTGTSGGNLNPSPDGDYEPLFNGTSSAAPIVAGAAALVLCANPGLGEGEVRRILCDTAEKVGSKPYQDGRNAWMGCGRVNVLAAVQEARRRAAPGDSPVVGAPANPDAGYTGDGPAALSPTAAATPTTESYIVVLAENGADSSTWRVARQEDALETVLANRSHTGDPWEVARRAGDEFVQPVSVRNTRTGAVDEGRVYRVRR